MLTWALDEVFTGLLRPHSDIEAVPDPGKLKSGFVHPGTC
jgi:hypothetical protein